ncbi:DUF6565 domain-containing protein [Rufibacter tibetensis]|uniref:Uncharacterized protein n=1 Tax=Rufibacter tibetensis TaxID=512763 RepID=A0A0P0C5R5_9BACT|nr:DUF6565 domain-containing protein [Rufibacter tibetensis]ALJ00296.1 hypothetical protein DC20_16615 [Rufibacter tibetensis]
MAASDTSSPSREQAYNDYKKYVTDYEANVARGWDSTQTDWDQRMTTDSAEYNKRRMSVMEFESTLDEDRKAEYAELQSRYSTAWSTREGQYNTWKQNNQSSGMMASGIDMSTYDEKKIPSYTATDIRKAYEDFVAHVEMHKSGFSNKDWNTVEKYWNQLDDRKNAIQSQLTDKDKWEIAKAKTKYIAMKNANKAGNTASKVGSDVKEVGKDVSNSKVGETTKEVGKDVASGAKKAGKAVGNTAKKAANKVEKAVEDDNK